MNSASTARIQEAGGSPRSRPVSIQDVARLAGVSNQTISRVLNGHPYVRGSTRTRVLAAMGELRYRPNRAARMLCTRRSKTIGVLAAAGRSQGGQASTIRAVEEAARERGYYPAVVHLASAAPSAIAVAADDLLGQEVEGVVIVAPQATVLAKIAPLLANIPIVTALGELRNAAGRPAGPVDVGGGAWLAMRYLLGHGHRRIVHIAGPPDWHDAQSRLAAYESELRLSGLPVPPPVAGDWSADSGYAAGASLVRDRAQASGLYHGVTAVFAANDQMALGLIHAYREAGLAVPADVSVVGFGDIPEAAHFWPPLTTVRQDPRELGRSHVDLLIAAIREGAGPDAAAVAPPAAPGTAGPQLIIRKSVISNSVIRNSVISNSVAMTR